MDEMDRAMFEAWGRVSQRLQANPKLIEKRLERLLRPGMRSVPRACCLAVRASDRRITAWDAVLLPEGRQIGEEEWEGQLVVLSGELIRKLCKPVEIPWPGLPATQAATVLGVTRRQIHGWIRQGRFEVTYENAQSMNQRGPDVPIVWHRSPMDPGFKKAQPPEHVWGDNWLTRWDRLPPNFVQEVRRWRVWKRQFGGRKVFKGWQWECPGRMDHRGVFKGCGRRTRVLYMPVPVWTLDKALGVPNPLGLAWEQLWGWKTLACQDCWGVVNLPWKDPTQAWNLLVRHFSGGVLYGRDVPMPPDVMKGVARTKR